MSDANTLVVLRHGLFSSEKAMTSLATKIETDILPGCTIDNEPYEWKEPVLTSGIDLASHILGKLRDDPAIDKIILVGHCLGGLVCRVAVASICDHAGLLGSMSFRSDPYLTNARTALKSMDASVLVDVRRRVHSVVMLGTPNSGTFTYGQLSLLATVAFREAMRMVSSVRWKNFTELTTDKLFTLLQNVRVPDVRYLSVSGSAHSRYGAALGVKLSDVPVVSRLAPSLDLPNDMVVEDSSVDLRDAPLPCEIADLEQQYTHVRSYIECIRLSHRDLAWDPLVVDVLKRTKVWQ